MKKALLSMMLLIGGIVAMFGLPGCSGGDALHGSVILAQVIYEGKTYTNTGEIVAKQAADDTQIPDNITFIGYSSDEDIKFDIFLIEGVDKGEAIAMRAMLVGETGGGYYYFKYTSQ